MKNALRPKKNIPSQFILNAKIACASPSYPSFATKIHPRARAQTPPSAIVHQPPPRGPRDVGEGQGLIQYCVSVTTVTVSDILFF